MQGKIGENCFWQNKLFYNANLWYNFNDVGIKRYFAPCIIKYLTGSDLVSIICNQFTAFLL